MTTMAGPPQAPASDALRTAGTLILLTRMIEADLRHTDPGDGLGLAEIGILGQVDRGVEMPSAIARRLRIDPGRVTRLSDRLVTHELLERESDPDDRRRCLLRLTRRGRERVRQAREDIAASMHRLLDGLSDEERAALTVGLEAARHLIEAGPLGP
jgi:DNA-binding MarR family transcriptional regulator